MDNYQELEVTENRMDCTLTILPGASFTDFKDHGGPLLKGSCCQ